MRLRHLAYNTFDIPEHRSMNYANVPTTFLNLYAGHPWVVDTHPWRCQMKLSNVINTACLLQQYGIGH